MRNFSYPPFVVFFDTLAVLLFYLLAQQSSATDIQFQGDALPSSVRVSNSYISQKEIQYSISCSAIPQCKKAHGEKSETLWAWLNDELIDEIARLKLLASENGCGTLIVFVHENGKINREFTVKNNECLQIIPAIEKWETVRS